MTAKKYPELVRHNAAKPLGKVTSIRSGKGRLEVTATTTPEGLRALRRMGYGHKPSPAFAAMNHPPQRVLEKQRRENRQWCATALLVIAAVATISFIAGDRNMRQQFAKLTVGEHNGR